MNHHVGSREMSAEPSTLPDTKALRIHGAIARDLGVSIVSGRYNPGELLRGEVAASNRLQVSRTTYREALRILAAKGLVESRPKTGTRVSPQASWQLLDPDVLSWIFKNEPGDELIVNLFELRRIVEPEAARLAAVRRTDNHLRDMAGALSGMARHTLACEASRTADQAFHTALLGASGNPFLVSLTSGIGAAVAWTTVFKQRAVRLPRDPVPDHRQVYEAIDNRDAPAAHRAMAELVDMALLDTMLSLRAARRPGASSDQIALPVSRAALHNAMSRPR